MKVFLSCLSDLTVHTVAVVADSAPMQHLEAEVMARECFDLGMREGLADIEPGKIPADARERFEQRLRETDWAAAAAGGAAFSLSPVDLARHAPVIDDFKVRDRNIVATSIGNNWREVRAAFGNRVVPGSIAVDWRRARRS